MKCDHRQNLTPGGASTWTPMSCMLSCFQTHVVPKTESPASSGRVWGGVRKAGVGRGGGWGGGAEEGEGGREGVGVIAGTDPAFVLHVRALKTTSPAERV